MVAEVWIIELPMTAIQQLNVQDHVTDTGGEVISRNASTELLSFIP